MEKDIVTLLKPIIEEIVTNQNLKLYSLEYVKEDGNYILRVAIEKQDGTMDFETAEVASDAISLKLDELDPIDHAYILEVCSPGLERPLNSYQDYLDNVGKYITVDLIDADLNGFKSYTGDLLEVKDNFLTISYKIKNKKYKVILEYNQIASGHLAVKF